jgi:hypothetical protein
MLQCGNIVLLTLRFLDVTTFTNLTPLSSLILGTHIYNFIIFCNVITTMVDHLRSKNRFLADRFCGLVVRVSGYRSKGPVVRFLALPDFLTEVVGMEWGPLSLMSTTEKLLGRKISGSSLEI